MPPPDALPPAGDDLLAKMAEAIPCDCDCPLEVTGAAHRAWCARMTPWQQLRVILEAAVPHIAAAERERIASLAIEHSGNAPHLREFADLIRTEGDGIGITVGEADEPATSDAIQFTREDAEGRAAMGDGW
jgi:hypothetical protein